MKLVTYVGKANIRRFGADDPSGELEFNRYEAVEVKNDTAKLLLEDPRYAGEFEEGEVEPPQPDVTPDVMLDDAGNPIPGL